ncbi:inositol hexakisphosphate kinase 3 [Dasypus novemcinctus]|uniref:inositol hexakisphosphate kinase 3 n=1 Tax=Dasypus novemcinctus TaxID=9361 RepID=UPI00265F0F9E|nr:inositol hexakisphosphate kinase 3 [Dasypus novemcinctus]
MARGGKPLSHLLPACKHSSTFLVTDCSRSHGSTFTTSWNYRRGTRRGLGRRRVGSQRRRLPRVISTPSSAFQGAGAGKVWCDRARRPHPASTCPGPGASAHPALCQQPPPGAPPCRAMVVQEGAGAGAPRAGVRLEPFPHQVGGHLSVMQYDERTVCKPLVPREQRFYESLPLALRRFTPQYKGSVTVQLWRDGGGHPSLVASPPRESRGPRGVPPRAGGGDTADAAEGRRRRPPPRPVAARTAGTLAPGEVRAAGQVAGAGADEVNVAAALAAGSKASENVADPAQTGRLPGASDIYGSKRELIGCQGLPSRRRAREPRRTAFLSRSAGAALPGSEGPLRAGASPWAERRGANPWGLRCHQAHLRRLRAQAPENRPQRFLLLENLVSPYKHPCVLDLKMGTRQHGDDASEEKAARHMRKCEQSTSASLGLRLCGMQVYQTDKKHFLCKDKYYGRKLSAEGFRQALSQFLHDGTRFRAELLEPALRQLRALLSVIRCQSSYRFYSSSLLIIYDGQEPLERPRGALRTAPGRSPGGPAEVDVRMIDFAHTTCKSSWDAHATYDGPDPGFIFGLENLIQILQDIQEGD